MAVETDQEYQNQAIDLLNRSLIGYSWSSYINKKHLLAMYSESKTILKQKPNNRKLIASADSVLTATARIVRCLCIEDEKAKETEIRGRKVQLDAESLYGSVELEYRNMKQIAAKSYK